MQALAEESSGSAGRFPCFQKRLILKQLVSIHTLNEAAARSRSAADVGGELVGGIIAAYDNTTTSKIHS